MKKIYLIIFICMLFPMLCYAELKDLELTLDEMRWLDKHPKLTFAVDDTYPPLNFRDSKGKMVGLSIEYVNIIAKKLEIKIKFEGSIWPEALQKAMDHKVDGIINASPLENRKPFLNFSTSYTLLPQGIVTLKDAKKINNLDDLIGLRICAKKNTSHLDLIKQVSNIKLIEVDTLEEAFGKILTKDAYGVFDDVSALGYLVQKYHFSDLKMNWVLYDKSIGSTGLGLRNDDPILLSVINKAIKNITTAEHKSIQSSWLMNPDTEIVQKYFNWSLAFKIIIPISIFTILCILLFYLYNRRLQFLVDLKTKNLLESEQFLYDTNKLAKVGGFNLSLDGSTKWTKELFHIYEIPFDEKIFFKNIVQEFHLKEPGKVEKFNDDIFNKKIKTEVILNFKTRKTRKNKWCRVVANPIIDSHGNILNIVGASQDITILRNAEIEKQLVDKQLMQSRKLESIGTMAAGIAHDFNNILFIIMGATQILMDEYKDNKFLDNIMIAGERGSKLIKQILSFSRQGDQQLIDIDIKPIVKESIKLLRSTIPRNIEFHIDLNSEDEYLIHGDPTQIHQIALNLINNSYHSFNDKSGDISISLNSKNIFNGKAIAKNLKSGKYIVLTVTDNGCGIEPNIIEKIFDPYFTTKTNGKGTGLGLSVVYGIVKEYGGDISVYSEVDKGTVFNVYIPSISEKIKKEYDKCVDELHIEGNENVLIVDDEIHITDIMYKMFKKYGYNPTVYNDPLDALNHFKNNSKKYNAIISDMSMPKLTGYDLSKELLKINPDASIIVCSGFSEKMNKISFKDLGIKRYLMKPIDIIELIKNVRDVIDQECNPKIL